MTATISVVSGGAVAGVQRFSFAKSGKVSRISAVNGARYVLADVDGRDIGRVTVKRVGQDLVLEQQSDAEQATAIIENFFDSEGQLVGLTASGEYRSYFAVNDSGAANAAEMTEGASALLSLAAVQSSAQPGDFQFNEGGSTALTGALAGMATVAGSVAFNNRDGGGKAAPSVALTSSLVLEEQSVDAVVSDPAPAFAEPGAVISMPELSDDAAVRPSTAEAVVPGADVEVMAQAGAPVQQDAAVPQLVERLEADDVGFEDAEVGEDAKGNNKPAMSAVEGAAKVSVESAAFSIDDIPVIDAMIDRKGVIQGVIESGAYTDDGRPQIVGKAEPGVVVNVYRGVDLLSRTLADENGNWMFVPMYPLADGRHSITIILEHPNGDSSPESEPYVIIVDKVIPDAPVVIGMLDDEGRITGAITEQAITDDNRPAIDGTAEAGATLIVYDKGKEIGRTTVGYDGKWSFTPDVPLADGLHIFSYTAVDLAGNVSERSGTSEFVVDTRPEKINIYFAEDDVGSITGEVFSGGVTDDSTPTVFGTATAGGIVRIYEGTALLGEVIAGVDGTWQFTPPTALSEGVHTLHATVTLVAKGESDPSRPFKLEVDVTAPSEPTIEQVLDDVGAVQGLIGNGQKTDDATPTLTGKAEKGSTVSVYGNGVLLGSVLADANGLWAFTPAMPLSDGVHTFTISATDAAGNKTASAQQHAITIDTLVPDAPSILSVYDDVGEVQGRLLNGGRTDDTRPAFSGKAEAYSTVFIRDFGIEIGRAQTNAEGDWSFTPSVALNTGAHAVTVVAMDQAGNTSAPSNTFDFTVSLTAPVAPSIESIYDNVGLAQGALKSGAATDDDTPLISGEGEPGAFIVLTDNGVELARVQVDAWGNWSFLPSAPLVHGLHNLIATEVDAHGTAGASSGVFGFRIVERGGEGGFENFNELVAREQAVHNEGLVYASGLVVSGTFGINYHSAEKNNSGIRWEDLYNNIYLNDGAKVMMDLPAESSMVSFFYTAANPGHIANYYDVNGEKIGQSVLNFVATGSKSHGTAIFQAPEGKLIASVEIAHVNGGAGIGTIYIDALQWGERSPTGISITTTETDSSGARIVYGSIEGTPFLLPNTVVQVSTDGGKTWKDAAFSEGSWAAIDTGKPKENWTAEARIVERSSGLSLGLSDSKFVQVVGLGAPTIVRIPDAEGTYTAAKAADGSLIELSLADTGAKQGDYVHIRWGTITYDQRLTKADIDAGSATIKMPSDQLLLQGASKDFSVTAQIIGKDSLIGEPSLPYEVETKGSADARDPKLIGSVQETFFGSDANDVVTVNMELQAYLNGAPLGIHGGGGTDTLKMGVSSVVRDFSGVSSMEVLDLGAFSVNAMRVIELNVSDVLRNGSVDAFYSGDQSRVQMMIKGSGTFGRGVVYLFDDLVGGYDLKEESVAWQTNGDLGDWVKSDGVVIDGLTFVKFQHSAIGVELLVQGGVVLTIYNRDEQVDTSPWSVASTAFGMGEEEGAVAFANDFSSLSAVSGEHQVPALLHSVEPGLFDSDPSAAPVAWVDGDVTVSAPVLQTFSVDLFDHNQLSHQAY